MMIRNALASEFEARIELRERGKARRENKARGVDDSDAAYSGKTAEQSASLASRSSRVERRPSPTPKEAEEGVVVDRDGTAKEQDPEEADFKKLLARDALPVSFILLVCSIAIAWYGFHRFIDGQTYAGLKLVGLSIMVFGGCLDPINFLWLCLPFTFSHVVASPRHARITLPLIAVGWVFLIIGWVGSAWLFHPPASNPPPLPDSP
jgi:hypothetical protein